MKLKRKLLFCWGNFSLKSGNPLVLLVSLEGCPFCKAVREHYLGPMRAQQGLPVVQLDMRSAAPVQDFNGAARTHDALVRAWNVALAPSVLFFGRSGVEVAPRLAGAASPDYYGAYLDERLAQARAKRNDPANRTATSPAAPAAVKDARPWL